MQSRSFHAALATYTSALDLVTSSLREGTCSNNNSYIYYSNRSAAHLGLNDYVSSIKDSSKSLALQPEYAKAHSRMGLAYFAKGDYVEAVASYERALGLEGGDNEWTQAHLEKVRLKLRSDDAIEEAEAGGKMEMVDEEVENQKGEKDNTTMKEEDVWVIPFNKNINVGYAVNDQEGDASFAEEKEVNGTIKEEEDKEGEETEQKGDEEDEQGKQNEDEEVEYIEEDAVDKQTQQADNHKDRGNSHMSKKEYRQALLQYNAAISSSPAGPNSHVYYSNRAAAYCYLAEYNLASDDCRSAIVLHPTYEKAHSRLGLSLFFQGDYAGSVGAYHKSLELDPENKASLSYLKKSTARWEDQKRSEEKEENEQEAEGYLRKRREWLKKHQMKEQQQQQSQPYQRQQQNRYSKHPDPRLRIDEEDEDDESSLGNETGITSTGLTSIVTNGDNNKEEQDQYQEAFDPFLMTDDECSWKEKQEGMNLKFKHKTCVFICCFGKYTWKERTQCTMIDPI